MKRQIKELINAVSEHSAFKSFTLIYDRQSELIRAKVRFNRFAPDYPLIEGYLVEMNEDWSATYTQKAGLSESSPIDIKTDKQRAIDALKIAISRVIYRDQANRLCGKFARWDHLTSKVRTREIVYYRYIFAQIAKKEIGLNYSELGRLLKRDHATIIHGLQRASDDYETSQEYRDMVENVLEFFNEEYRNLYNQMAKTA